MSIIKHKKLLAILLAAVLTVQPLFSHVLVFAAEEEIVSEGEMILEEQAETEDQEESALLDSTSEDDPEADEETQQDSSGAETGDNAGNGRPQNGGRPARGEAAQPGTENNGSDAAQADAANTENGAETSQDAGNTENTGDTQDGNTPEGENGAGTADGENANGDPENPDSTADGNTEENTDGTGENTEENAEDALAEINLAELTQALNEDDELVDISEEILELLWDGTYTVVKFDEGYRILNKETGKYVDPQTGEEYGGEEIDPQAEELERDEESEAEAIEAGIRALSNEELIARQEIVVPPRIEDPDFRFYTVSRVYAFANETLKILEKRDEDSTAVGILQRNGLCFVLKDFGDGWYYVESGSVRGFAQQEKLLTGADAEPLLGILQYRGSVLSKLKKTTGNAVLRNAVYAEPLVAPAENKAFTYLRATTGRTIAAKDPALAAESINIREAGFEDARVIGRLSEGSICYILADADKEWVYVESGDVRGFAAAEYLLRDEETKAEIYENGMGWYNEATEIVEPEDNKALYYTLTSTTPAKAGSGVRDAMLEYAVQFVGNPYVWGGEDLVFGADCSGFVMRIYEQFGYELPRVSEDQAQVGMKIPVEEAAPGDLIFYAKEGHVYHVVMYAGNGQTIEAMSEEYGIVCANVNYQNAVWATRLLEDEVEEVELVPFDQENAWDGAYGESVGSYEIRYFTAEDGRNDTASSVSICGTRLVEGRTVIADPEVFKEGTQLIIDGHVFTVSALGHTVEPGVIWVYVDDQASLAYIGRHTEEVYRAVA